VPEIVVKSLESLRVAFFWGGHEHTKKIAWVKSSNTLASLDKGGFGAGSLKAFNKALLLKWKWHLFQNPNALWVHVVKAIHGDEADVDLRGCQTNRIWASIVGTISHLHSSGIVPLNFIHFKLSHLANNKDCFIRQRIVNGSWDWDWSRPITMGGTKTEFDNLILDIASLESDESVGSNSCIWNLSNDDTFSVNKVRKHIEECSLSMLSPSTRWYKMIPKKVNRLPNRLNLSSRGLDLDSISCMVCNGSVESNTHIFFTCDTATSVWRLVESWTGFSFPIFCSCEDWDFWFDSWHASKDKKSRTYTIFAATCWTLWCDRNNITLNSQSMSKCDIFDFICLVSFSWLKSRGNICSS
ncbi:RNA-directed DNA polymerase, eukaryota, reverse transcriptase zinc-binding domain protein, partial [Tanacetum coccineum]